MSVPLSARTSESSTWCVAKPTSLALACLNSSSTIFPAPIQLQLVSHAKIWPIVVLLSGQYFTPGGGLTVPRTMASSNHSRIIKVAALSAIAARLARTYCHAICIAARALL
ncbi:hypothetical protein D3C85_1565520 [compost metagenome]